MMQRYKIWLLTGAALGGLSVATGAIGAHVLKSALEARQSQDASFTAETVAKKLDNWETAARYQMYHALGLLAVGFVACRRCGVTIHLAGVAMTLGTLLFSGCLYAYVLTAQTWLVRPVPVGGLLMIAGWLLLAIAIVRLPREDGCEPRPSR